MRNVRIYNILEFMYKKFQKNVDSFDTFEKCSNLYVKSEKFFFKSYEIIQKF